MGVSRLELTKQHFNTKIYGTYLRYLRKTHSHVNWNQVISACGLEIEYLENENNWVSLEYDHRFMKVVYEHIEEKDFVYNVGRYSVSREGVGAVLYALARYGLSITALYRNLWNLSAHFNKVMKFQTLETKFGYVALRATPLFEDLAPRDQEFLKQAIPYIIENARGLFGALPLIKDMDAAEVEIQLSGNLEFDLLIRYNGLTSWSSKRTVALYFLAVALVTGYAKMTGMTVAGTVAPMAFVWLILTGALLTFKVRGLLGSLSDLRSHLHTADNNYRSLIETKIDLERRLGESRALNAISENLIKKQSENEVVKAICQDLTQFLEFDRTLVFLKDEQEKHLEFRTGNMGSRDFENQLSSIRFAIDIPSRDPSKISNVFRNRTSILISDVKAHLPTLNEESRKVLAASGSTSFVCVPIASEKESYGVLIADTYHSRRVLTEGDKVTLETVGRQLALHLEKEKLVASYRRFVPFELFDLLGCQSVSDVKITSGRELEMCVVFCDIRGFTTMAENMAPMDSVAFLNSYYSNLSPIFVKHGGVIDKFLGDGMMVLFGSADQAIASAVEYQIKLVEYNTLHRSGNYGRPPLTTGLGLHFGRVLLGAVGYAERLTISVVSDAVNLASRIDGLTKLFGIDMICTDEVVQNCKDLRDYRLVGELAVQGRKNISKVYEIFAHLPESVRIRRAEAASLIGELLQARRELDLEKTFDILSRLIEKYPDDPIVKYYFSELKMKTVARAS